MLPQGAFLFLLAAVADVWRLCDPRAYFLFKLTAILRTMRTGSALSDVSGARFAEACFRAVPAMDARVIGSSVCTSLF